MASVIAATDFQTNPGVNNQILAAGNYYVEVMDIFISTFVFTAVNTLTVGIITLKNTAGTRTYFIRRILFTSPAAGALVVLNLDLILPCKMFMTRGDDMQLNLQNIANVGNGSSFNINVYGETLL